jgi:ankyrin repeat protein
LQDSALLAVQRCFELGLDINTRNQKNQTALHGAVYLAGNPLISYLIENGADINALNDRGQTPWMIAGQGEYRAGSLMTLPQVAAHLERLGADTTLGEDLGRYYARDARDARDARERLERQQSTIPN